MARANKMARPLKRAYRQAIKVHFADEAPRIGSGWRFVIPQVGRKWVYLRTPHGAKARLRKDVWERLST